MGNLFVQYFGLIAREAFLLSKGKILEPNGMKYEAKLLFYTRFRVCCDNRQ